MKVFVGGLPFSASKMEVREKFEGCGEIDWLHMPRDAKGRSRGIAFISYWDQESLDKALELDGAAFEGRTLKVNMSTAKPAKAAAEAGEGAAKKVSGASSEKQKAAGASSKREVFI